MGRNGTAGIDVEALAARCRDEMLRRNGIVESFFTAQAPRLAEVSQEMSRRFLAGGRLLAFGDGAGATDAQHVAVEFVHPVIVGKRALPALDLGRDYADVLPVLLRADDTVMGFASQAGDSRVHAALQVARGRGALTLALPDGTDVGAFAVPDDDPFVRQEVYEILYHLLWETVHVYVEHREQGHDVGASSFLYPFLGAREQGLDGVRADVQLSMVQKTAEVNAMRTATAEHEASTLARAAVAIRDRLDRGGHLLVFGNGGSATDANDLVADCVSPPPGLRPIPAVSLCAEPATLTAIANDIGSDAIFTRQLIAQARPDDVAIAISTSGNSANLLGALEQARRRGLLTVALAGYDGGRIAAEGLAAHVIVVRSDYIPRIQEVHASAYHVLRRLIDDLWTGQ